MKTFFNQSSPGGASPFPTPPKEEACHRSVRAINRHLIQLAGCTDRQDVILHLAKIRLIERNLFTKPGKFAPGQYEDFSSLMRCCLAVEAVYRIGRDDLFTAIAPMRPDWVPEDRLARYAEGWTESPMPP